VFFGCFVYFFGVHVDLLGIAGQKCDDGCVYGLLFVWVLNLVWCYGRDVLGQIWMGCLVGMWGCVLCGRGGGGGGEAGRVGGGGEVVGWGGGGRVFLFGIYYVSFC